MSRRRMLLPKKSEWDYYWVYDAQNPTIPPNCTHAGYEFNDEFVRFPKSIVLDLNYVGDCILECECAFITGNNNPQCIVLTGEQQGFKVYAASWRTAVMANGTTNYFTRIDMTVMHKVTLEVQNGLATISIDDNILLSNATPNTSIYLTKTGILALVGDVNGAADFKSIKFKKL